MESVRSRLLFSVYFLWQFYGKELRPLDRIAAGTPEQCGNGMIFDGGQIDSTARHFEEIKIIPVHAPEQGSFPSMVLFSLPFSISIPVPFTYKTRKLVWEVIIFTFKSLV
jgi:hypothetical protein